MNNDGQENKEGMRLAKYLATAGVASRRASEQFIIDGYVCVNDQPVLTPAMNVVPGTDKVTFKGRPIVVNENGEKVYLILHKPVGYTCSAKDEHAEKLVFDLIPDKFGRLFSVGRLDRNSEGLLILTNDGDFAQRMTHPSHQVPKQYLVQCEGQFTTALRRQMLDGVYDGGEFLRPMAVEARKVLRGHCILEITLTEGKNREVRRICRAVGLEVTALKRIAYGRLELGDLPVGRWRVLDKEEVQKFVQADKESVSFRAGGAAKDRFAATEHYSQTARPWAARRPFPSSEAREPSWQERDNEPNQNRRKMFSDERPEPPWKRSGDRRRRKSTDF